MPLILSFESWWIISNYSGLIYLVKMQIFQLFFRFSESFTAISDGWKCCVNPVCLYITKSLGFICRSSVINSALSLLIAFLFETSFKNCRRFQCGNPISVISNIKKKLVFLYVTWHFVMGKRNTISHVRFHSLSWGLDLFSSSAVCLIR